MQSKTGQFIRLVDSAMLTAKKRMSVESDPAIAKSISNVISVLQRTKDDAVAGSLNPSGGIATLGFTREALDWGEPLDSPLLQSLRAVDRYYRDRLRT